VGVFEGIFLGGLVAVVIAQVIHRGAGGVLAVLWCAVALGWGLLEMEKGVQLRFFGMQLAPVTFAAVMIAMGAYNGWVAVRHFRRPR
jgi:hypothetical protein